MIFVTIGSAFPFDRLIRAMDAWAAETGRGGEVLAQTGRGSYRPGHMAWQAEFSEADYTRNVQDARVMVSHAGMGSVITALCAGTPLVILPRRFEAGEHTTDHQMATARWLEGRPGIFIAWDEGEIPAQVAKAEAWQGGDPTLADSAPKAFTEKLAARLGEWLGP